MSQFTTQEDFTQNMNVYSKRNLPFLRRNIARYFARGMYARRRSMSTARATSADTRQLGTIVRSYRKANSYQIQPSSGRTVSFWRKSEISIALGQSSGFNGVGNNVNWGFGLGRIFGFVNGVFTYSIIVPGSTEFQALFDYYKINAVKMQIFFSKTAGDQQSGAAIGMPMLLIANDFDDIAETMTLNSMNERVGVRHVQFDGNNTNGITHYIKPKPTSVIVQTDVTTGVQSTSNSGVVFGTQWLDSAQSNIVHNGVKVFYNNQGVTAVTTLGNVTFVFDVEYVFKGYR